MMSQLASIIGVTAGQGEGELLWERVAMRTLFANRY